MLPVRRLRGFTLIEMMMVVAIVGVLAGMAAMALSRMKTRGNFASATGDFAATLRAARAEAFGRGNPTVVIVDTQAGAWWAIEDVLGTFTLASFDPANPAPSNPDGGLGDRLIYRGTLPSGVSFGPSGGIGQALPMPFSGIPTGYVNIVLADGGSGGTANITADGGSSAPNFAYCSFCDTGTGKGAITFLPSGGATFSGGPGTVGQQLSIQDLALDGGGGATSIIDYAIVAATGSIEPVTIR
jgi:prepilin-type N-terminal cleavage/methylation domain-containing protein